MPKTRSSVMLRLLSSLLVAQIVVAVESNCFVRHVRLGDRSYNLERRKLNFYDAAKRCMDLGGQLVTIDDEEELNTIQSYLNELHFKEDELIWTSGVGTMKSSWVALGPSKIMTYFKWHRTQPDDAWGVENCLGIQHERNDWYMHDLNCLKAYASLCEGNWHQAVERMWTN